jgi:hypothetical protein
MGTPCRSWGDVLKETPESGVSPKGIPRWVRWVLGCFGGLSILAIAVGFGAVLWLRSSSGEAWLEHQIQVALDEALVGGEAKVGSIHSNGWSRFELAGVRIVEGEDTLVQISKMDLTLRLWELVFGRIQITKAEIESLDLDLRVEENGGLNLARLFASDDDAGPSEGLPLALGVQKFEIEALSVSLDTGSQIHQLTDSRLSLKLDAQGHDWRLKDLRLKGYLDAYPLDLNVPLISIGGRNQVTDLGGVWKKNRVALSLVEKGNGLEVNLHESQFDLGPAFALGGFDLDEGVVVSGTALQNASGWALDLKSSLLGGDIRLVFNTMQDGMSGALGFKGVESHRIFPDLGDEAGLSGVVLMEPSTLERQVLRVVLDRTRIKGHAIDGAAAEMIVEGAAVELESARVRHAAGLLQIEGRVDQANFIGPVRAQIDSLEALKEFGVDGLKGRAGLSGDLALSWSDELQADFEGVVGGRDLSLSGAFALGRVEGPISARLSGKQIQASGGFKGASGAGMQAAVGELFGAWSMERKPGEPLSWEVELEMAELAHQELRLQSLSGAFQGIDSAISGSADLGGLSYAPLFWPTGRFDLREDAGAIGIQLSLLDEEKEVWKTRTRLDLTEKNLRIDELVMAPAGGAWSLGSKATLNFSKSDLGLETMRLQTAGGSSVDVGFDSGSARLDLKDFPLPVLDTFTGNKGHQGSLTGSLERNFSLDGPHVTGRVFGTKLIVPGWIQGLKFDLSLKPEAATERLVLNLGRGAKSLAQANLLVPFSSDGRGLDWDGGLMGTIRIHPVDNNLLRKALPFLVGLPPGFSAGSLELGGTLRNPRLDLETGVEWMLGTGPEFLRADVFLKHRSGQLSGHGSLRQAGRPLADWKGQIKTGLPATLAWLAGEAEAPPIHLWDHWWQDGQVRVVSNGMAIDSMRPLLPFSLPVEGNLSGSLLMEGKPSQPWVHAGFSLANGRLGEVEVPMAMISISPDSKGYGIFAYGNLDKETLQVDGRIDLDLSSGRLLREKLLDDSVRLQIKGSVPLSVAGAWSDSVQNAKGSVGVQGEITGSILALTPDLRVTLKGGAMDWVPEALRINRMSFEGRLKPTGFRVPRFSLKTQPLKAASGLDFREHESLLEGAVNIPLAADGLASLELTAVDAWLSAVPKRLLRVDGGLSAEGPLDALRVNGRFQINESRFERSSSDWLAEDALSLDPGIHLHRNREVVETQTVVSSLWSGWDYDLEVDLGSNTWIEAEVPLTDAYGVIASKVSTIGLMGRLDGLVRVQTADGSLGLQGEVEIQKGKSKVFGTDFEVESGRLLFSGGSVSNPILDLRTIHDSGKYGDIRVDIQGQPENLQLGFSSSEGWSDTDMAAILLFKRPASTMTQSEGGAGLDLLGAAIGVMAGQASQFLRMSRLVDLVEVESSGEAISAIRLGWSIGDDLFLTYVQDYSAEVDENTSAVTLEWLLSRRLQAEFSTGDAGESSADLFVRWRF